ncbi:uncharacterized protein EDB91DRAFT_1002811, partial [Suillus paluster]|uniref:uncharacterized protein n=1 Tax=Suillus paluster TaxID=48578 RepID=UPI001B8672F7
HRDLWKGGVCHHDVNYSNLMFYRTEGGRTIGILNDFDLASLSTSVCHESKERIGTIPFMSLDLHMRQTLSGDVEHLYRHDL